MKKVLDMTVTQIRIYPADCLPFVDMRRIDNVKTIKEAFRFENAQSDPFGLRLVFSNGVFGRDGESTLVLNLTVEQRRVLVQVRGSSSTADSFYSALANILAKIAGWKEGSRPEPLLKTDETTCVAALDIDFENLIAPQLLHFVQTDARGKLRTKFGNPKSITFKNLSFEVKYEHLSPTLEEHDVSLANKLITFEPRMGTPMRERRFFTSSPTNSETHLQILKDLERELARSTVKGESQPKGKARGQLQGR